MSRPGKTKLKQGFRRRYAREHLEYLQVQPVENVEASPLPILPDIKTRKLKRLKIDVYDGYGTTENLVVTGRIISDQRLDQAEEDDSRLKNLVKTTRRFISREVKDVWVCVSILGTTLDALTNEEGIFCVKFDRQTSLKAGLYPIQVSLSPRNYQYYQAQSAQGNYIIHEPHSDRLGIITDIDDTVLLTEAHSKVRLLKNVFLSNYKTQKPIPGMNKLFHAIHTGPHGDGYDATHYVSSSPDNLYSRINQFLLYREFPEGSIDLKNIGLSQGADSLFDHEKYKIKRLRKIFQTYPQRKYVLFGDSGEHDPEIYHKLSLEFSSQVMAVYIHNVTGDERDNPRYHGQFLFKSAHEVAADLIQKGLVYAESVSF